MSHGARAWLSARLPLRLVIFVAYAAAGWGLLALLWFGLLN